MVEGDSVVSVANVQSAFTEYHPRSKIFQLLFHFFYGSQALAQEMILWEQDFWH